MLHLVIRDLKEQLPEIFEKATEEQVSSAIQSCIEKYQENRELPVAAPVNWQQRLINKLIRKHVKLPRKPMPKRDRLPYVAPEEKTCTKCSTLKPIAQFNLIQGKYTPACSRCYYDLYQRPAALRRLAKAGKKPLSERTFQTKEEIAIKKRANASKWGKANRDRKNAANRARRILKNPPKPKVEKPVKVPKVRLTPEQLKANRKEQKRVYRLNNPEKVAAERVRGRLKAKGDPAKRIARSLRRRLRKVLKGNYKTGTFVETLGCTSEELRAYLEGLFVEGMSWANYGDEWHIDHIEPLCSFNLLNGDELNVAANFKNLRPLWAMENSMKSIEDTKKKWRG